MVVKRARHLIDCRTKFELRLTMITQKPRVFFLTSSLWCSCWSLISIMVENGCPITFFYPSIPSTPTWSHPYSLQPPTSAEFFHLRLSEPFLLGSERELPQRFVILVIIREERQARIVHAWRSCVLKHKTRRPSWTSKI